MLTTIIIFILLGTNVQAELYGHDWFSKLLDDATAEVANSTLTEPTPPKDENEKLLAEIGATCLSPQDLELLTGNTIRYGITKLLLHLFIGESVKDIGLRELRETLHLPPRSWQHINYTEASEHELESVTSNEEYFELRRPHATFRSLDSTHLFEHNVDTAVAFLDQRVPAIRNLYKRAFKEICPTPPTSLDKPLVDRLLKSYRQTLLNMKSVYQKMITRYDCFDPL